jgi:hypothetical protein
MIFVAGEDRRGSAQAQRHEAMRELVKRDTKKQSRDEGSG